MEDANPELRGEFRGQECVKPKNEIKTKCGDE